MGGFGQKEGGGVARGRGEGNVWGEEENDEEGGWLEGWVGSWGSADSPSSQLHL